ncbi:MAG: NUDIX hydrolase [Candidatus Uhrbacteria bacterium]|nr:NUDIX hydrolase [Candidatus Uhrbacteria bacterium]
MPRNVKRFDAAAMAAAGKKPGWKRREGAEVITNDQLGATVLHVVVCNDDAILWDQILRCEIGGGVFLPVDDQQRIGLQKQWRPQTKDQAAWKAEYPNIDVSKLGRDSWEIPRGFAKVGETGADAAVREAQEETESVVVASTVLGDVCDNTALSPHMTAIQIGKIDPSKKPKDKPDVNEKMLAPLTFFTLKEIKQMVARGEIYDAYTLAALGLYYIDQHGN